MKAKAIIDRLKAGAASLGGRISGSAEFEEATKATDLALPAAFVMRMLDNAGPDQAADRTLQVLEEHFAVLVVVSNQVDPRGYAGSEQLDDVRGELLQALLGWRPDADHSPLAYVGGQHLAQDRARLWHQFSFSTESVISNL